VAITKYSEIKNDQDNNGTIEKRRFTIETTMFKDKF
jgi:hypothetical protein